MRQGRYSCHWWLRLSLHLQHQTRWCLQKPAKNYQRCQGLAWATVRRHLISAHEFSCPIQKTRTHYKPHNTSSSSPPPLFLLFCIFCLFSVFPYHYQHLIPVNNKNVLKTAGKLVQLIVKVFELLAVFFGLIQDLLLKSSEFLWSPFSAWIHFENCCPPIKGTSWLSIYAPDLIPLGKAILPLTSCLF